MSTPTFSTLGVPAPLVASLTAAGITEPFPIQVDTLPDTLGGRDVLGRGKTGSGKTLAFSIPMVARLGGKLAGAQRRPNRPLGLILARPASWPPRSPRPSSPWRMPTASSRPPSSVASPSSVRFWP